MIAERAKRAIDFPAHAPALLESLAASGLVADDDDDRMNARAALQWVVHAVKRQENLLMKLCASWGVKDP